MILISCILTKLPLYYVTLRFLKAGLILLFSIKNISFFTLFFLSWEWKTGACRSYLFAFSTIKYKSWCDFFVVVNISSGFFFFFKLQLHLLHWGTIEKKETQESSTSWIMSSTTKEPQTLFTHDEMQTHTRQQKKNPPVLHGARTLSSKGWIYRHCKFRPA